MTPEHVANAILNMNALDLQRLKRLLQDGGGPDIGVTAPVVPFAPTGSSGATVDYQCVIVNNTTGVTVGPASDHSYGFVPVEQARQQLTLPEDAA